MIARMYSPQSPGWTTPTPISGSDLWNCLNIIKKACRIGTKGNLNLRFRGQNEAVCNAVSLRVVR
jgi:hypothetical protein